MEKFTNWQFSMYCEFLQFTVLLLIIITILVYIIYIIRFFKRTPDNTAGCVSETLVTQSVGYSPTQVVPPCSGNTTPSKVINV